MKNSIFASVSLVIFLLFSSCEKKNYTEHISNGDVQTYELPVEKFTGISVECKSNVSIVKGDTQKVTIRISSNIVNDISLSVVNGLWLVDYKKDNIATINEHEFTLIIEVPNLTYIEMQNSGSLSYVNNTSQAKMAMKHYSSGNVSMLCNVQHLETLMEGSGLLTLQGNAINHKLTHDSSGKVLAKKLNSKTCSIAHYGSGNSYLHITDKIKGNMDGSGNVYYIGSPLVNVTVEGSGELINSTE